MFYASLERQALVSPRRGRKCVPWPIFAHRCTTRTTPTTRRRARHRVASRTPNATSSILVRGSRGAARATPSTAVRAAARPRRRRHRNMRSMAAAAASSHGCLGATSCESKPRSLSRTGTAPLSPSKAGRGQTRRSSNARRHPVAHRKVASPRRPCSPSPPAAKAPRPAGRAVARSPHPPPVKASPCAHPPRHR